ncbi:MAG: hypothetical protein ACOCUS_06215 [Polyangiales bacterium]
MPKPPLIASVLGVAMVISLAACGSSQPEVRQVTEFTEQDAELFEDGVDLIADPEQLEGRWRKEWSRELDLRVRRAEFVGLVTVHTLRTDIDPERRSTYRLLVEVDKELLGEAPDELTLTVHEGQGGFGTIHGNDRRILNQPFVAFLKWYRTDEGGIAPHWHLAPAAEPVAERVKWLIEKRHDKEIEEPGSRRVIIHDN